jgi:hypothetical protein
MDYVALEKKCQKIVELRTKRLALQEEINKSVGEVLEYMNSQGKRNMKVGKFSLEVAKRVRREFDFDALDKMQSQGLLPNAVMSKKEYQRLLITSSKNMKLVNGKFVYD